MVGGLLDLVQALLCFAHTLIAEWALVAVARWRVRVRVAPVGVAPRAAPVPDTHTPRMPQYSHNTVVYIFAFIYMSHVTRYDGSAPARSRAVSTENMAVLLCVDHSVLRE